MIIRTHKHLAANCILSDLMEKQKGVPILRLKSGFFSVNELFMSKYVNMRWLADHDEKWRSANFSRHMTMSTMHSERQNFSKLCFHTFQMFYFQFSVLFLIKYIFQPTVHQYVHYKCPKHISSVYAKFEINFFRNGKLSIHATS